MSETHHRYANAEGSFGVDGQRIGALDCWRPELSAGILGGAALAAVAGLLASHGLDLPDGLVSLGAINVTLVVLAVFAFARRHLRTRAFGLANAITLTRGCMAALLAATLPFPDAARQHADVLAAVALAALLLDGFDGWWARRSATASAFGARFDQEMDALLTVVLSALVFATDRAGSWVLAAGALRYVFSAAGRAWPWLAGPLPASRRRQAVCVISISALIAALGPWLGPQSARLIAALAVVLLFLSFAADVMYLHLRRRSPRRGG